MTMKRVQNIGLDGSTVTLTIGRHQIPCLSGSYGDSLETETVSYMGSQRIDERTAGTYKTEPGKVKMTSIVFRAQLYPLLQKRGYGTEKFQAVFTVQHPDLGSDSDLLDGARFTSIAEAYENSAKSQEVEFGVVYDQLYLGDERKTINKLDTSQRLAPSKL